MPDEEVKRKRGRPKGSKSSYPKNRKPADKISVPEGMQGYNANVIAFLEYITPESKGDKYNLPEMKERFKRYIQACADFGIRPSNMNAYRALGIHKANVFDWINGLRECPEDTRDFLIDVSEYCASYRENLGIDGKIHPATLIFWQRNYDGLKDQHEQVIINRSSAEETVNENELSKRYLENASVVALPDKSDESQSVQIETTVDSVLKETLD